MEKLVTTLHLINTSENKLAVDVLKDLLRVDHTLEINATHTIFLLDYYLDISEIIESFELLQDDLGVKLSLYNGFTHDSMDSVYAEVSLIKKQSPTTLYQSLYPLYINDTLIHHGVVHDSLKGLKNIVCSNHDNKELIQKLWHTQGNIAQSATELFIHRNTLIYRLDRLKSNYFIDLKNPHVLLMAYLLTLDTAI